MCNVVLEEALLRSPGRGELEKWRAFSGWESGDPPRYAGDVRPGNDKKKLKTGETDPRRVHVNSLV